MSATVLSLRQATRGERRLEFAAMALIIFFLAGGLHRVFITNINWDEFYYLSFVHLYRNGTLTLPLQTLHVRAFAWLPWFAENEVHQIFAARLAVWAIGLLSAWLIYRIARRICARLGALFAVALYLSFTYVVDHGLSFRADPFCAILFLLAAYLLITPPDRPSNLAAAAFALAAAMMISLKSVFNVPTIAVLVVAPLLAQSRWFAGLYRLAAFGIWFLVAAIGLFLWHNHGLASAPPVEAGTYAASAGNKTLGFGPSSPAWPYVGRAVMDNLLVWVLIAYGVWVLAQQVARADQRTNTLVGLSFALPLLSVVIYRNTFPYFFVFLMPAAVIPAAVAVDRLAQRAALPGGGAAVAALAATLAISAAGYAVAHGRKLPDQTAAQMEVVRLVHAMFPEPVPYIDRNSMVASFPKVGFFMSTWGLESYRAANQPIMAALIARHRPPLLVANTPALDLRQFELENGNKDNRYSLFDADIAVLKENYVHHWGPVYVAGKYLALPAGGPPQTFEIVIAGTYTLESARPAIIDDVEHPPGAHIQLAGGAHRIATVGAQEMLVTLRWGRNLFRPKQPPSLQPIYVDF